MAIELVSLPLPPSADASKFADFGKEVRGVNPGTLSEDEFKQIEELLYKHSALLFRDCELTPEQQYALTKAFDPTSENYGHGNNKTEGTKKSILHPDLKTIPRVPQVQLIGNGTVHDHEGLAEAKLKHPSHTTFHKTRVSPADEAAGATRFYRWHIDAALYDLNPPRVTTLYGLVVPQGAPQVCRYDDGTGDELPVPLGTTAFVSGKTMFDILPPELKSLAVRTRVRYAPHPYVWMSAAHAMPTGLGIESESLELAYDELPQWKEDAVKTLPVLWKNPVTGALHFQVHPCGAAELIVAPLPAGAKRDGALYPDGAHIKDLKTVRELLYKMQRPAIAPTLVYPHDWREKDLVLFHNRGVLHSVVGAFAPDQVRAFHQCNLAASDEPAGPSAEDVERWA
ncbi:Clavaminate synthase-like protein [Dentipellis sp. KUC8613]|nr:Clavaminate synthase-like protein [Dentipellis sp. KUC8613]